MHRLKFKYTKFGDIPFSIEEIMNKNLGRIFFLGGGHPVEDIYILLKSMKMNM